jgi:hypothetical protein
MLLQSYLRPILNFAPRGEFVPWGCCYPLGVKFSVCLSILLNNRECSPLGVNEGMNIPPRGQISPLGARCEVKNGPLGMNACGKKQKSGEICLTEPRLILKLYLFVTVPSHPTHGIIFVSYALHCVIALSHRHGTSVSILEMYLLTRIMCSLLCTLVLKKVTIVLQKVDDTDVAEK